MSRAFTRLAFFVFSVIFAVVSSASDLSETFKAALATEPSLGFYNVEQPSIPPPVQKAAHSIFRVGVVSKLGYVPKEEFKSVVKGADFKKLSLPNQQMTTYMLDGCLAQEEDSCLYPIEFLRGTAFLAGDKEGRVLWTNAHVAIPALSAFINDFAGLDEAVAKNKMRVPLFLFDQSGKLVATPTNLAATLRQSPSEAEVIAWVSDKSGTARYAFDFVHLDLDHSIGSPIPIASKADSQMDQPTFKLGFPACTQCGDREDPTTFSRAPQPDSDGVHEYVTFGQTFHKTRQMLEALFGSRSHEMQHVELSTEDMATGMSGSPVLNKDGEVLGIAFAGNYVQLLETRVVRMFISDRVRPDSWNHLL